MRVGVIQSNYIPWRGYFDFIDDVDVFVVHDDLQFTKGDWRNRNRIKTARGTTWLTVPVHYRSTSQLICDTPIDYSRDWTREHRNLIAAHLGPAPYVQDVFNLLDPVLATRRPSISALNVALLKSLCSYLRIATPLAMSSEFNLRGTRTARLIDLLTKMGATSYLSGPSARAYLDERQFEDAGIALEYKEYVYPDYPQLWGPFDGAVSIIDTIANCGPAARTVLKSASPQKAVAA
jgi:hypothetical protein